MARQAKRPGNPTGKRPRLTKREREGIVRRIKEARRTSGMTQADFGLAVGVGQAAPGAGEEDAERSRRRSAERTVQAWENRNVVPRRETLVQIARLNGHSLAYLLTGEDTPDPDPGKDLESRLRSVEGRLDTAITERRGEDARPMTIAALVASLRGEDEGVTLTALREAVAVLAEQTEAIVLELAALRREVAAPQRSDKAEPRRRTPRAKGN